MNLMLKNGARGASDKTKSDHARDGRRLSMRAMREGQNSIETTLLNMRSQIEGLTVQEARERLLREGPNEVAHERRPPALVQLAMAFANPFIAVLVLLAAVSSFTDIIMPLRAGDDADYSGVAIILTMVSLSGLLRFWQEYRSGKAAEALKAMVRTTATVLRRQAGHDIGEAIEIPMRELVCGDVIRLSAGDMIPADVRLMASRDLFVSQSALTGEAIPIEKYDVLGDVAEKSADAPVMSESGLLDISPLDISNVCFMGTNVVSGTATAIVVATGSRTYFGSLAKAVVGARARTAFDRGVNSVSWLLIRFMAVMIPIVLFLNGVTKGDWTDAFLFALAVGVGLTPEMLPMIVSSNLAKGAVAMARRKVVVKRINAIQNLGAMDVLCTDKTGTLTQDRIILERHLDASGRQSAHVLQLAWLNSFHQSGLKNVMDRAVLRFVEKADMGDAVFYQKVDELPFDFERRRLSVVLEDANGENLMVVKGAAEEMLAIASHVREADTVALLDDTRRAIMKNMVRGYNEDGFRVLLIGTRRFTGDAVRNRYTLASEREIVIEGLLTFLDPPKETARSAIAALSAHGVAVKVLTGDNAVVAACICAQVGLEPGTSLTGQDIERLSDAQLREAVEAHTVFARLTPLQKSRIVRMLQSGGHTVGFLGDGINDAPALCDADVGISVDSGTDIARESADIILLEKDLMVLEKGVVKGRETFGNIVKYLNMTASANFGNVFSVLVASAFLPFLPMLAIHLLIQNLIYDTSQLSLPWDRMDREFLDRPRRWDAKNIGRFMLWMGPTSSIFDMTTFALMWYVFGANSPAHQALFQSGWFIEGLLSQTLVVHMLRTQKVPFFQSTAALPVLLMTGAACVLGVLLPYSPVGAAVGLVPLPLAYFPWLAATLLAYCLLAQGVKVIYIRRYGQWF